MPVGRPMSPGSVAGVGRRGRRRTRRRTAAVVGGASAAAGYAAGKSSGNKSDDQPQDNQATQAPQQDVTPTEELEKLGDLHEKGILTDEEFEAKKKEVLARM